MSKNNKYKYIFLGLLIFTGIVTKILSNEKHEQVHWSYEGATGPDNWGEYFPACKAGKNQSPIDIKGPLKKSSEVLDTNYNKSILRVLDNGHTIQVNYDKGSLLTVAGRQYSLVQFHFHKPSEEKINGIQKEMVAHFVHKNSEGQLAVIGVLIEKGSENSLIKTIWENLPKKIGKEEVFDKIEIKAKDLLPQKMDYYHFMGSLTTPPCTEGVAFYILKNTVKVSASQINTFPYKMNARPTQSLNNREISESGI